MYVTCVMYICIFSDNDRGRIADQVTTQVQSSTKSVRDEVSYANYVGKEVESIENVKNIIKET